MEDHSDFNVLFVGAGNIMFGALVQHIDVVSKSDSLAHLLQVRPKVLGITPSGSSSA